MNVRIVVTGTVMIIAARDFFYMGTFAPKSNDPAGMMQTVGEVSGTVGAIGLVMMVFGALRRKPI